MGKHHSHHRKVVIIDNQQNLNLNEVPAPVDELNEFVDNDQIIQDNQDAPEGWINQGPTWEDDIEWDEPQFDHPNAPHVHFDNVPFQIQPGTGPHGWGNIEEIEPSILSASSDTNLGQPQGTQALKLAYREKLPATLCVAVILCFAPITALLAITFLWTILILSDTGLLALGFKAD